MTYMTYLENGGAKLYPEMDVGRADGKPKVQCKCGAWAFAQTMIDVRTFNRVLTEGEKFICDGCYSSWERQKRAIDPGDNFLIRHEFRAKFAAKRLGRPDPEAEKVKLEYLEKEKERVLEDESRYASAPDDHPDKVALKSKRVEIEKRIAKG